MPDLVAETTEQPERTAETADASKTPRSLRAKLMLVARIGVILVVAAGILYAVVSQWKDIVTTLEKIAWESLALALLAAILGYAANTMGWRAALADLEFKAPPVTVGRIYLVGQLAKYIPGSVWAFALQMELGRRAGLPRARAFLASLVATGLGLTAGLVVGILVLPSLFHAVHASSGGDIILYGMIAVAPIALICAHPRVLTFLVQLFLKLVKRKPLEHRLSWPGVLKVMGWSALAFVFFGVHLWLLTNSLGAPGLKGFITCIGAFALALVAGTVFVISPSGLGAREAVMTAALVTILPNTGTAAGVAIASRVVFIAADLLSAGAATLSSRRHLKHHTVDHG